jgi:hypothetical protein
MITKVEKMREQRRIEHAWEDSRRAYELARRREIVVEYVQYHEQLAGVFRGHAASHEREQKRYQSILTEQTGEA